MYLQIIFAFFYCDSPVFFKNIHLKSSGDQLWYLYHAHMSFTRSLWDTEKEKNQYSKWGAAWNDVTRAITFLISSVRGSLM